jgi:hypothetical protein
MGKKTEVALPVHEHVAREKRDDVVAWVNARESR